MIEHIFFHEGNTLYPARLVPLFRLAAIAGILVLACLIANVSLTPGGPFGDLGDIGNGKPVVVLVNAGKCIGCDEVTERVVAALAGLDELQFRVVDVCTREWKPFSEAYHAEPVSVMLFDADGLNTETVRGLQSETAYHALFQRWTDEACARRKNSGPPDVLVSSA